MLLPLLLVQAAGLAPVATRPAPVTTQPKQQTALSAPGLATATTEDLEAVVGRREALRRDVASVLAC